MKPKEFFDAVVRMREKQRGTSMKTKKCKRCEHEKPVTEFGLSSSSKDGLQSWCKDCLNEYNGLRDEWRHLGGVKYCRKCHENAVKHGFWENNPSDEHCLMLVITEVSEMVEADRKGKYAPKEDMMKDGFDKDVFEKYYKNTVEDEMADIAIRLLDLAWKHGYLLRLSDIGHIYPWAKRRIAIRSMPENAFELCARLCRVIFVKCNVELWFEYLRMWAESLGIDLERHIMMKMEYNESRPFRHDKKY